MYIHILYNVNFWQGNFGEVGELNDLHQCFTRPNPLSYVRFFDLVAGEIFMLPHIDMALLKFFQAA